MAQLAAQPLPTLGQQTAPLQLPWQQSASAWHPIPAEVQLPAAGFGFRPEPRAAALGQQPATVAAKLAKQARAPRFTRPL